MTKVYTSRAVLTFEEKVFYDMYTQIKNPCVIDQPKLIIEEDINMLLRNLRDIFPCVLKWNLIEISHWSITHFTNKSVHINIFKNAPRNNCSKKKALTVQWKFLNREIKKKIHIFKAAFQRCQCQKHRVVKIRQFYFYV